LSLDVKHGYSLASPFAADEEDCPWPEAVWFKSGPKRV